MEAIKEYLDNVFAAYPQTREVQSLKRDMLADMEEKYAMLRQGGKSEHEAAYSVLTDFGNIEEIAAEWGLEAEKREMDEGFFLTWDEARAYIAQSKQNGIWIGLGVWLIIAGVSSVVLLDNVFILFLAAAVAVTIFIVSGRKMEVYESYGKTCLRFEQNTRAYIESARMTFSPRCTAMIAIGVAIIIISAGAFAVTRFSVPLFLNVVAFSVFLLILAGSQHAAFDRLLGKGDYTYKSGIKKSGRILGTISAVYWPVVTAFALTLLFTGNMYFWVVWPVAGVLYGGVCAGVSGWVCAKENAK